MNQDASTRPVSSRVSIALGAVALVLAIVMVVLLVVNHGTQARIADNAKQVAKTEALAKIDRTLVQLLAKSAFENHDADITALLARNGVTFKEKAGPQAPAAPASGGQ